MSFFAFSQYVANITSTVTAENTQATSSATQTHSSLPLGPAFSGRKLIVLGSFDGPSNTLATTGCTVAGNAATKVVEKTQGSGADACVASIYVIELASGTSGDVVFSLDASSRGSRCAVISLSDCLSAIEVDSGSDKTTTGTALSVGSIEIRAGGYAVGVVAGISSTGPMTFSGITEFGDGVFGTESAIYGMAHDDFAAADSSATLAATITSSAARASLAVASFR